MNRGLRRQAFRFRHTCGQTRLRSHQRTCCLPGRCSHRACTCLARISHMMPPCITCPHRKWGRLPMTQQLAHRGAGGVTGVAAAAQGGHTIRSVRRLPPAPGGRFSGGSGHRRCSRIRLAGCPGASVPAPRVPWFCQWISSERVIGGQLAFCGCPAAGGQRHRGGFGAGCTGRRAGLGRQDGGRREVRRPPVGVAALCGVGGCRQHRRRCGQRGAALGCDWSRRRPFPQQGAPKP